MTPHLAPRRLSVVPRPFVPERRVFARYGLELNLRYKLWMKDQVVAEGEGKTCNLSTGGIFFQTDRRLPRGFGVELSIDWPILLDGSCPLRLTIMGDVVRNSELGTGVKIVRYEFRTRGRF